MAKVCTIVQGVKPGAWIQDNCSREEQDVQRGGEDVKQVITVVVNEPRTGMEGQREQKQMAKSLNRSAEHTKGIISVR